VHSFETELVTQAGNLTPLAAFNRELIARPDAMDSTQRLVPDLDSTEIPLSLLPLDLWLESPERTGPDYPNARSTESKNGNLGEYGGSEEAYP
jgi:hypothetical protein